MADARKQRSVAVADLERAAGEAAEQERHRLAQALHDTVCQSLSGIHLMARVLARKLEARNPEVAREVRELSELLERAVGEAHDLMRSLRPESSETFQLAPALAELARATSAKVPCAFDNTDPALVSDPEVAEQLFQIAQDAVNHMLEQNTARSIVLCLKQTEHRALLTVRAKGASVAAGGPGSISAVDLLNRRARMIGGAVTVDSHPKGGVTLSCHLPVPK